VDPLITFVSLVALLGIFLIMQGINAIELGINMPHEKKSYIRIYKRSNKAVKIGEDENESQAEVNNRIKEKEQHAEEIEIIETLVTKQQR
jgi:hypothetical protein